jgi:coenzyme PQQ precursor peptide PqqA
MNATSTGSTGQASDRRIHALAGWERPTIEEVCVALEINDYASCTPDLSPEVGIPAKRTR